MVIKPQPKFGNGLAYIVAFIAQIANFASSARRGEYFVGDNVTAHLILRLPHLSLHVLPAVRSLEDVRRDLRLWGCRLAAKEGSSKNSEMDSSV